MEVFGARPLEATTACFDEIAASDALVGIYAHRYGYVPLGQTTSITEQEFDFAREKQKPAFCFIADEEYPWPPKHIEAAPGRDRLLKFKSRLQTIVVPDSFTTADDLAFKVSSSLGRHLLSIRLREELEKLPNSHAISTEFGRSQITRRLVRLENVIRDAHVLIVNDIPGEMKYVIDLLGKLRVIVEVETSTDGALRSLSQNSYHVIISDMQRGAVQDEGIKLLARMRSLNITVPLIFTEGRFNPTLGTPPFAFGITNRVDELLNLLCDALERIRG
jgi:CheY-like chemotaxis protein